MSLEARVMTKNIPGVISPKEGATFISETFNNNTLSTKEIRDRLYAVREKLGTASFEAAKETAKASNPNMQNYEAKAGDTASQSIADILAKKVLMYSSEYFQQRQKTCGLSDSDSSGHGTRNTSQKTPSVEEREEHHTSPYISNDPNSLRRHYGWPLIK